MRVGCDQKHEEELDSEAIYKNFVLRVMAARSPNVKLRKALNRKSPSLKCPLTAPAKSSKPRVSRLALISSISHKIVDAKDKARPLHTKITATTPNVKAKQPSSVAKALTTPRNRKPISNPDTFRSVRNSKAKNVVVPKNRIVAKALVFNSPKKTVRTKGSSECGSNVGKLCAAIKKLDITSGKKHVLGYTKTLPLDTPRKQLRGREVKSRVFDSLHSNKGKGQEAKPLKRKKMEKDLKQCYDTGPYEEVDNDSSDMKVEEKLRKGSLEGFSKSVDSKSNKINGDEEHLEAGKSSESSLNENQVEVVSETSKADISSLSSSEKNDSEVNCDQEKTTDGNGHEDKPKLSSGMGKTSEHMEEDDNENAVASDNTEHDNEIMHTDDKENRITSEDNREQKRNGLKRKNLGNHSASKNSQKVIKVAEKIPKENSTSAPTNAQGVKYSKPKPTNPKPFRFRTDERGMLKEANSEKKVHAPLKEITLDSLPEKSTKKHQNVIQTNKTCLGQIEYESDSHGSCEKRRTRSDQNGKVGATCLKTSKGDLERKLSVMTPPQRYNVLTAQKPQKERIKSPMVQPSFTRPRGVSSKKKSVVSSKTPCQLSIIKESVSTNIRPRKAAKPCGVSSATKARTPSQSSSRGRRPATIPKEPHFHTIHVPKNCTRLQKEENDFTDAQQN
ncbi:hypothetical protein RchiOBHm_Chr6g0246371 [Rosa chinensis]|uniref:Uncharacterized protein n=1 Tax=Rosa chinensis TaxID=74649 RepID=A0A2P6PJH5_ROSCH|nr:uncharacterized protein LOC112173425 [Rosa chinensis]PRQ22083.1 hypothetical protein RchiOBHm_Chr6g0246371 [Rosa chinensis]